MISIIIPSYKEPYLLQTIDSILDNAQGAIEIFVNVDNGEKVKFPKDPRVRFNYPKSPSGMRGGINKGLKQATRYYK